MAKKNTFKITELQKIRSNLLAIRTGATPSEMSERIRDLCNQNGYDPVFELMELIRKGERVVTTNSEGEKVEAFVPLSATEQIAIHKEMLKYVYPQIKSVEMKGQVDTKVTVIVKKYDGKFHGDGEVIDVDSQYVEPEKLQAPARVTADGKVVVEVDA